MHNKKESIVTIGIFDGIHKGHQKLISTLVDQAHQLKLQSVVFTFDPHPAYIHSKNIDLQLVNSIEERVKKLHKLGVDIVHVIEYNLDFAKQTPESFIKNYFVDFAYSKKVIVGEDMKFGKDNMGDCNTLIDLGEKYSFDVDIISDIKNDDAKRYSSSFIRNFILDGAVHEANEFLGRNFNLYSNVVHGYKNGRKIGYPTANLDTEVLNIIPKDGVYAGYLEVFENEYLLANPITNSIDGLANIRTYINKLKDFESKSVIYPVAISVGTNYQFEANKVTVEAHVLGRSDLNLYGKNVSLEFVEYIRPMQKFDSLDGLLEQMRKDVCKVAEILGVCEPKPIAPSDVTAQ